MNGGRKHYPFRMGESAKPIKEDQASRCEGVCLVGAKERPKERRGESTGDKTKEAHDIIRRVRLPLKNETKLNEARISRKAPPSKQAGSERVARYKSAPVLRTEEVVRRGLAVGPSP